MDEQMQETLALLAVAVERAGGRIEVTAEELAASKARFGIPAPLMIARMPDDTIVARLSTLEGMVEEQWPIMAACLDLDETEARAAAEAVQQQLMAQRAVQAFHRTVHERQAEQHAAKHRDGMN